MKNKQVRFTTQTAMMLALLVVVQFMTGSLGQLLTGSLVNMILLVTTFMVGLNSGLFLAFVSPFLAHFLGIGPAFIQIVVFVALGNVVLVTIAWLTADKNIAEGKKFLVNGLFLVIAGIAKTAFLWLGLVKLALPLIPGLTDPQIAMISTSFTWPQIITACIGAFLTLIIVPMIKKSDKK